MEKNLKYLKDLSIKLRSLTVFRGLKSDPVISALLEYLNICDSENIGEAVEKYCAVASALYESGETDIGKHICGIVGDDENVYMLSMGKKTVCSSVIIESVNAELAVLQELADLTVETLCAHLDYDGYLPSWNCAKSNIAEYYRERTENIGKYGQCNGPKHI